MTKFFSFGLDRPECTMVIVCALMGVVCGFGWLIGHPPRDWDALVSMANTSAVFVCVVLPAIYLVMRLIGYPTELAVDAYVREYVKEQKNAGPVRWAGRELE